MKVVYICFPEGRYKALTMSYDDGREEDRRLVDLFNRRGIKGTFHLNSGLSVGGNGAKKNPLRWSGSNYTRAMRFPLTQCSIPRFPEVRLSRLRYRCWRPAGPGTDCWISGPRTVLS